MSYCRVSYFFFFFNDTATTEIYTLSLHDALPIWRPPARPSRAADRASPAPVACAPCPAARVDRAPPADSIGGHRRARRSEEHTSELQSHLNLVCRLLL